ncbi:DsbC family protein [Marinimicrobium sp. ARAG 43.8]|uniref:DsbC family protein n=1 Tax=Marinimicrobium sp. ARAG 43.8 TaxID=3418719 RepID=UPI003CE9C4EF
MWKQLAVGLIALAGASAVSAQSSSVEDNIIESLSEARPDFEFTDVRPAPFDGLYQVQVTGGPVLYVNEDASLMIAGDVFTVGPNGFARYEDPELVKKRKELAASLKDKDSIAFAPEGESKAVVYVFTDVDCGFCRRLHSQMHSYQDGGETKPGYNDLGIEIRYLAYPRAGVNSPSARKLETAWCADDRQAVMDRLKNLQAVDTQSCDSNPVAEHYRLGGQFGVNGTPALILPDGSMQPGYLPPERLAQTLGL